MLVVVSPLADIFVLNACIGDTVNSHSQAPSHQLQRKRLLKLKASNKKEWAFTNGLYDTTCITNNENGSQLIGAGVYHPQSNKVTTANPGGKSIKKTINRAVLAGVAADLINEHTRIATDSAGAQW